MRSLLGRDDVSLLTLTGPGGVGKTRLALQLAASLDDAFDDGVTFVPFASVTDSRLILPTIARAVGIGKVGDMPIEESLEHALAGQRRLLVLDNFEHLASSGDAIARLLSLIVDLKVMVTSRVPLHVTDEQEFPVPPLPIPDGTHATLDELAANPAVRLFVQRAQAVRPEFALVEANADVVADVCRRLDGLPLAIELAAARSKVLAPQALLARLAHGLGVLSGGSRDKPARLQTMTNAIAWSYNLLSEEHRAHFRRLAVISGGATLELADAMCVQEGESGSDTLEILSTLCDNSLLQVEEGFDGEPRFTFLQMNQEFALEQLVASGEVEEARDRHATWCLAVAEEACDAFADRMNQTWWLDRMESEHGNLRAALAWLDRKGDAEGVLLLSGRLFWFWYVRGYLSEGRRWLERALEQAIDAPAEARARALLGLAVLHHWQGNDVQAGQCLNQSLLLWHETGNQWGIAFTHGMLGVLAEDKGEFATALPLQQESLRLFRLMGNRSNAALVQTHLGITTWGLGDLDSAISQWQEALAIQRDVGDTWAASISLSYLGLAACERRELLEAATLLGESLKLRCAMRTQEEVAHGIANFGVLATACGQYAHAAMLFGAAETGREAIGLALQEPERSIYTRSVTVCRQNLGEEALASAWAHGRARSTERAVAAAFATVAAPAPEDVAPKSDVTLTAREHEVLRLLVMGRTDREIGEALFVSHRTAHGHVANILAKLNVHTRTAAATAAIAAGLTDPHSSSS